MTGFRAPIDVTEYVQRLGGDGTRVLGYRKTRQQAAVEREYVQERWDRTTETPWLRGLPGHALASSCTALEATPTVVWDVNGYYRSLGLGIAFLLWRRREITRAVLREAFHAIDGETSVLATYALKQLLDPLTRWEYDRTPLGEVFYDDLLSEEIRLDAKREAGRRLASGQDEVSYEEVLDEWGLKIVPPSPASERPAAPPEVPHPRRPVDEWSYYLWRGAHGDFTESLWEWQRMLVAAFSANGIDRRFAVGYTRRQPHSWVTAEVKAGLVVFLNEDATPTSEMAAQVVAYVGREDTD